jgi:hypothetical protein
VSQLFRKCGSLDVSQPFWPPQPVTGIAVAALLDWEGFKSWGLSESIDGPSVFHFVLINKAFKLAKCNRINQLNYIVHEVKQSF